MSGEYFVAGEAALWIQRNGPNTRPEYLGCHAAEDVEDPENAGELTLMHCPDPANTGKYRVSGSYVTQSVDPVSTTISTKVGKVLDLLEKTSCRGTLFVHKAMSGRRDLFPNHDRSLILHRYVKGATTYSGLASMQPDDEAESLLSAPFQAEALVKIVKISGGRQAIGAVGDLTDVALLSAPKCADEAGPAIEMGDDLVTTSKILSGSAAGIAEVWLKRSGLWAVAAADPFVAGEDISAACAFPLSMTTWRIIVARGTTDAGNPAEVSYSDNYGAIWTPVDVGTLDGQYVPMRGLWAIDQYHIWCVCDDGYVYFSGDAGLTWTLQENGTLTARDLNRVEFLNTQFGVAVGNANTILHTDTGGDTWSLITGPATKAVDNLISLEIVTEGRWFVGYDDGEIWYTENGGNSWTIRRFEGDSAGGEIRDIAFDNELVGFMIHEKGTPLSSLLRTIDGGYTWEPVLTPANVGLSALLPLDSNAVVAVGAVVGGTAVVVEAVG